MPLYFKEFDANDAIFQVTSSPTISYLKRWEPIDREGTSMLMAQNRSDAGEATYQMMKKSGVGNLRPGSTGCIPIKVINDARFPDGRVSLVMTVRWFDIVKPTGILRWEDDDGTVGFVVYFKYPQNSESDFLVAIANKLVPVGRDDEASDGTGHFFFGDNEPFAPPVMRAKPRPWKSSDPEVIKAKAVEKIVVMPAVVLEHLKAELVLKEGDPAKTVDDGSIVKIFTDGRLWSSNTSDPLTHYWAPVVCHGVQGHCAGDVYDDWMPHLIGV